MKKLSLSLLIFFCGVAPLVAQSDRYQKAMQARVAIVDSIRSPQELNELSAAFERIGEAEKTQWLPFYYAALTQVNAAYRMGMGNLKPDRVDPIADKAEALLNKAEALQKSSSEIFVVKKMIASLRMMADPMNRWQTYGPLAAEALQTAKSLDQDNPRIFLLEAQDKFFTPEQFGGSKAEAKKLLEQALQKYKVFKPATPLDPAWGQPTALYFLSQIK